MIDWMEKPPSPDRLRAIMQKISRRESPRRPRVLHVEDDEDVPTVISAGLDGDVATTFARSVAEARQRLATMDFDLVILDLALPDGNGLDLLADLPETTPVIVFSAADAGTRLAGPVRAFLTKTRTSEIDVAKLVKALLADSEREA